jgi:hypothetical protein
MVDLMVFGWGMKMVERLVAVLVTPSVAHSVVWSVVLMAGIEAVSWVECLAVMTVVGMVEMWAALRVALTVAYSVDH